MSACAGMAKPIVSVISRSFLITISIPPKNSKLGNGKLALEAKNLSISMWKGDPGISGSLGRGKLRGNFVLGSHRTWINFDLVV